MVIFCIIGLFNVRYPLHVHGACLTRVQLSDRQIICALFSVFTKLLCTRLEYSLVLKERNTAYVLAAAAAMD